MKKYIFLTGCILLSLSILISCKPEKKERTLTVSIDESLNGEAQWVYWISLYGNEWNIIDSCFIEKGQTEFVLRDTIMNDSINGRTELVFSEVLLPWEYASFMIDKNDRDIRIHNLTLEGINRNGCTITGALAAEEAHRIFEQKRIYNRRIFELKADFMYTDFNDSLAVSRIVYEMDSTRNYLTNTYIINQFDSVQSTTTKADLLRELVQSVKAGNAPKEKLDSIVRTLEQQYPQDIQIQMTIDSYVKNQPTPPATARSDYWAKRRSEIRFIAYNKRMLRNQSDGNYSMNPQPIRPPGVYEREKDTTNIPAYTLGTKIGPLKLPDIDGKLLSISDMKTDYVLIDFWAAWCIPCIREIPTLKKVHDQYKDKFSVYIISLNNSEAEWKEAIEKYKCRQLNHVHAGSWANEDGRLITNSFGVESLPANFLLDKNRRIIAVNLRGEELEKKLKELIK